MANLRGMISTSIILLWIVCRVATAQETSSATPSNSTGDSVLTINGLLIDCNVFPSGNYSIDPCERMYVVCDEGRLFQELCPESEVFDEDKGQCNTPLLTAGCSSTNNSTSPSSSVTSEQTTLIGNATSIETTVALTNINTTTAATTMVGNATLSETTLINNVTMAETTTMSNTTVFGTTLVNNVTLAETTMLSNTTVFGTTMINNATMAETTMMPNTTVFGTTLVNNVTIAETTMMSNTTTFGTTMLNNATIAETTGLFNTTIFDTTMANNGTTMMSNTTVVDLAGSTTAAIELNGTAATMLPTTPVANINESLTTVENVNATMTSTVASTLSSIVSTLAEMFTGSSTVAVPAENGTVTVAVENATTGAFFTTTGLMSNETTATGLITEAVRELTTGQLENVTAMESTMIGGELNATTPILESTTFGEQFIGNETTIVGQTTVLPPQSSSEESYNGTTLEPAGNVTFTILGPRYSNFSCGQLEPGIYGNPNNSCDTKFFICVARSTYAYEQDCPAKLHFDDEMKRCDSWAYIPSCSGQPRPVNPEENRTAIVNLKPPVVDCYNLTDGNYQDPESTRKYCSNRYFTCLGRQSIEMHCPAGLYFDTEIDACDSYHNVYECSGVRVPIRNNYTEIAATQMPFVDFDCSNRTDGFFSENCSSIYFSCSGGEARQFQCLNGLVFDPDTKACLTEAQIPKCGGVRPILTTYRPRVTGSTTPLPIDCDVVGDGVFRDPEQNCSRVFYYCSNGVGVRNLCPANLYYDVENKRCDLWIRVFSCSNSRVTPSTPRTTTTISRPAVNFDCSHMLDGNYVNPKNNCSQFFYICGSMEAYVRHCPNNLYYDPERNLCDKYEYIYACTGERLPITTTPQPRLLNVTAGEPEFDCLSREDGSFANSSCSNVYWQCSSGMAYKSFCPLGLYFDEINDRCDEFENIFNCTGRTLAPTSSTASTTTKVTPKPSMSCNGLADGDYADPSNERRCSNIYYTCTGGYIFRRQCPVNTFFDEPAGLCDAFEFVEACSGRPRPTTPNVTASISTSTKPSVSFDCTRLFDGNYGGGACVNNYWSCVGGVTFPRRCPPGLIYDEEFDQCEFQYHLPNCGGRRPVTEPPVFETENSTFPVSNVSSTPWSPINVNVNGTTTTVVGQMENTTFGSIELSTIELESTTTIGGGEEIRNTTDLLLETTTGAGLLENGTTTMIGTTMINENGTTVLPTGELLLNGTTALPELISTTLIPGEFNATESINGSTTTFENLNGTTTLGELASTELINNGSSTIEMITGSTGLFESTVASNVSAESTTAQSIGSTNFETGTGLPTTMIVPRELNVSTVQSIESTTLIGVNASESTLVPISTEFQTTIASIESTGVTTINGSINETVPVTGPITTGQSILETTSMNPIGANATTIESIESANATGQFTTTGQLTSASSIALNATTIQSIESTTVNVTSVQNNSTEAPSSIM